MKRIKSSNYLGVSKRRHRWRASIQDNFVHIHLGHYDTPEEAAHAYDAKVFERFGPDAKRNFPDIIPNPASINYQKVDGGCETIEELIDQSIKLIHDNIDDKPLYVGFSGGKDSIVMLDIIKKANVPYETVFHITGLDPPELMKYIHKYYPETKMTPPKKQLSKIMIEKGFPPTRLKRYCCQYLKEQESPLNRVTAVGVRAEESTTRKHLQPVMTRPGGRKIIHPIFYWAVDEIWEYIHSNKLPYCSIYDDGFKRIGCIGCPLASKGRVKQFERWPLYERLWRKWITNCWQSRVDKGKPLNENWSTPEKMFDWWME